MKRMFYLICKIFIEFYIFIYNVIFSIIPSYIYVKTRKYGSKPKQAFSLACEGSKPNFIVHTYWYNYNKKLYTFNFIDGAEPLLGEEDVRNRNIINHACIISADGEYISDITSNIKEFIHLQNKITWKYVLVALDLNFNIDDIILINLNDENMTEKRAKINDLISRDVLFYL